MVTKTTKKTTKKNSVKARTCRKPLSRETSKKRHMTKKANYAYYDSKMEDAYNTTSTWEESQVLVKRVLTNALKNPNLTKAEKKALKANYDAMIDDNS
jgi:hypothetical protein